MESNRYVHPHPGFVAWFAERIANSSRLRALRRKTIGKLPFPVLASDVVNVVYATWLVDADRARRLAPAHAELWEANGLTPFTILTYQHRHFGLKAAGPFRKLFPSPLQSNWRLYLASPLPGAPDCPTVAFVKNILDSTLYALSTRVFSDALPSHLSLDFSLAVGDAGASIAIRADAGSAPRFAAQFERSHSKTLPSAFAPFAASWESAVSRLASQDAAVVPVHEIAQTALAKISLPLDLSSIEPLWLRQGTLQCPLLRELGAKEEPLCFLLPSVYFQALSEQLL
nr:hypothetical protein [Chromobacterium sp. ASV5]